MSASLSVLIASLAINVAGPSGPTPLEHAILSEINVLRADPPAYARRLEAMAKHYDGVLMLRGAGLAPIRTVEGKAALLEAIDALHDALALPPLLATSGLARAARDHVVDTGPTGAVGHRGTDGSNSLQRISRRGSSEGLSGEVAVYGWDAAQDVVVDLLIDDGIRDRSHRRALLRPQYAQAGAACGAHARFRIMCVVEMAERFRDADADGPLLARASNGPVSTAALPSR